ncbi:MAG: hypothetical protein L3J36_11470 [Rhodobacteraceae bacterium]|nr:hypothetical protein [Paracoccaceae bacterium]
MRLDKLGQMSDVMRALYDREFRVIAAILAEESNLRGKLTQLDAQVADNLELGDNAHSLNVVGAQLLWQGWTSRTRRQLNGDLAQVMAKKLVAMDKVRIAFGRQRAVEMMMTTEQRTLKQRQAKQRDINLLSLG